MARNIEVTPEMLPTAAASIESMAGDYKTQYETLYKETSSMASTWSGKDNQSYISQIEGFKDDLEKMYKLMGDYAEFLRTAAKAYQDTQDAVTTEAKNLLN